MTASEVEGDDLSAFEYKLDPNEQITELLQKRLPWEVQADIQFSKNGIV